MNNSELKNVNNIISGLTFLKDFIDTDVDCYKELNSSCFLSVTIEHGLISNTGIEKLKLWGWTYIRCGHSDSVYYNFI